MIPKFEFYSAKSLQDALDYLVCCKDEVKIISGGTDLIPQMEQGKHSPK